MKTRKDEGVHVQIAGHSFVLRTQIQQVIIWRKVFLNTP
jgi:hypothetical protein